MAGDLVLSDEGELYAAIETTYGTSPASTTLVAGDVANLKTFKSSRAVVKVSTEDQGGGLIPGVPGQPILKVGEHGTYSGSMLLREFAVPATDTGARPDYDIFLRSGGLLAGVYSLGDQSVTYNMSLGGNGESIVMRRREWDKNGKRVLHDMAGCRHGLKFKFIANNSIEIELVDGNTLTYTYPSQVAAADAPPSLDLGTDNSAVPFIGATTTLTQIGGSTYTGKIRELNVGLVSRTEMLPSASNATGYCEAFSNQAEPTFDILMYEVSDALQMREAWAVADAHFRLVVSVPGPGTAGNTIDMNLFFDIMAISEEAGPSGTLALRLTCKLLYGDRSSNTNPGVDPSESPFQLVLTTA